MEDRDERNVRIKCGVFFLSHMKRWTLSYHQLRSFIDGLLKDLEAEANDLKVENKTGDYVDMLQYCLYVYEVYIFRLGLNTAEDDMRFLVLKAKLPLAAVYMGQYERAIDEARNVVRLIDHLGQYEQIREEAQLILSVANAGSNLLKYRNKGISKVELQRQKQNLHYLHLNTKGTEQKAMLKQMIEELGKELGPNQESAEAEINDTKSPDLAWIPDDVLKHQEKVEAYKTKKQQKKKKCRSRPTRTRSVDTENVSPEFHESNRCEDREDVSETPTRNDSLATEKKCRSRPTRPRSVNTENVSCADALKSKCKPKPCMEECGGAVGGCSADASSSKDVFSKVGTFTTSEIRDISRCEDGEDVSETPTSNDSLATELQQVSIDSDSTFGSILSFKYELRALCGLCFPRKTSLQNVNNRNICSAVSAHRWRKSYAVYQLLTTSNKWVRVYPRNPKLRPSYHPIMCRRGPRCDYRERHNLQCMFCHYPEEIELWEYQQQYSLPTIAEVIAVKDRENARSAVSNSQSSQDKKQLSILAANGAGNQYSCSYCNETHSEQWKLELHLKTPDHLANIKSDEDKKWYHRDPATAVTTGNYIICEDDQSGLCRYSGKRDVDNICEFAHGEDEVQEWKERHKYRMMKIEKVRKQRLFSFLDELLEAFNLSNKKETVMVQKLQGVDVKCIPDLEFSIEVGAKSEEGLYKNQWVFQVNCEELMERKLKRVGLLYDDDRPHFFLSHPLDEKHPQVCPGRILLNKECTKYSFEISFTSAVLGVFQQWVVLDFGDSDPVLYVPLKVRVASEHFRYSSPPIPIEVPWNANNSEIVKFPERHPKDPFYLSLEEKYLPPASSQIRLKKGHKLNRDNVQDHFHKMLWLEELARNDRLKKFTRWTKLETFDEIKEDSYYKAQGGELYAKISLTDSLLDDSEASQIVVSNVQFALLKFDKSSTRVYQAKVLTEKHLDLRNADSLYVSVGAQCVQDQQLEPNKTMKVLVQFQLERIHLCEMHFGVDNVTEMNLLFPPANMEPRFPKEGTEVAGNLNPRQSIVSEYIVGAGKTLPFVPGPTLLIGAFGTGKTETLARSIMKLLDQSPNNKILVCTHSNSAADVLVTSYLHKFLTDRKIMDETFERKLLRVYASIKNPASVNAEIKSSYAIFEDDEKRKTFRKPTYQDIIGCNIVVTTLATSIHLVALSKGQKTVKGYFGYIVIDEAGQALETEAMIPLGLAVENTVVVLSGDHIQIRPKVYSQKAKIFNFHASVLERLFEWNQSWQCRSHCLLTYNYRVEKKILDFITSLHYGGKLTAMSVHHRHPGYYPLSFLAVKGHDQLVGTSYINTAEVSAIVEQVQALAYTWPHQWGDLDIAVLTPYRLQVEQIRQKLRSRRLSHVNVESVQNVQGKQFKAVFISTVRTRKTLNKAQITTSSHFGKGTHNEQYYYGFLSDKGELITALTRCQCLLYVIGDPIALCSVGDCHGTWEKYIKECQENYSLFPPGTTLGSIKQKISAATQQLNPCAQSFQPQRRTEEPKLCSFPSSQFPPLCKTNEKTVWDEFCDREEYLKIDDAILKEVRKQVQRDQKTLMQMKLSTGEAFVQCFRGVDDNEDCFIVNSTRKDDAEIDDVGGDSVSEQLKVKDNIHGSDDDSIHDTDTSLNMQMVEIDGNVLWIEEGRKPALNQGRPVNWPKKVREYPEEYKICIMRIEPSGRAYAVLADGSSTEEIIISSKRRRERALDGDRVVMHILSETEGVYETLPLTQADTSKPTKLYGEVKHILERSVNPKFKKFVCTIDPDSYDLMCPFDRRYPKMVPMGRIRSTDCTTNIQIYNIIYQGDGRVEKDKVISLGTPDKSHQLFVVQYFKWSPDHPYPIGIVTEVLPPCDSPRNGIRILKLIHGVKDNWPHSFAQEIEKIFPDNWEIPEAELTGRAYRDFRKKDVFTVDPPESQDLDDALHVEKLTDGRLRVGVHIADVSYFIKKGSNLDKEASTRAVTFYPSFHDKPSHMLPTLFSTILCSLLPSKDRLTLSVIFMFEKNGTLIGDPEILRSVVCSVQRLTYRQVEMVLADRRSDDEVLPVVRRQIRDLYVVTSYLRRQRLGDGRFFNQTDEGEQETKNTMAHMLVEEMMILTNEAVANYLVGKRGNTIPVRYQPSPDTAKAQEWLTKFGKEAENGLKLSSMLPLIKEVTKEDSSKSPWQRPDEDKEFSIPDSDVIDFSMEDVSEEVGGVPLTKTTWENIRSTLKNINHSDLELQNIIGDEGGHPKQAVALSHLYKTLGNALYTNASKQRNGCHHFSLQKDFYTHFTSPIRRFIDLVVHRMLVACLEGEEPPYTAMELDDICHHCNNQTSEANKFSKMTQCLHFALKLQLASETKLAFIESVNDTSLQVLYPHERYLQATRSSTSIPLKHLKPSKKPDDGETINSVILHFKNSIYDYKPKVPEVRKKEAVLKTDRFIQSVPKSSWKNVLSSLKDGNINEMEDLLDQMVNEGKGSLLANDNLSKDLRISEITSEVDVRTSTGEDVAPKKYVDFKRDFECGQVVQVQLTAGLQRGLLVPKIQLFNMTPKFNFCIEHRENPVNCFAKLAEKPPDKCKNITQYVKSWLPLVEMMVVHNTVSGDETTYIRDVPVKWFKQQRKNGSVVKCGCFSLKRDWCDDRNIRYKYSQYYFCIRLDSQQVWSSSQMKHRMLECAPGDMIHTTKPNNRGMSLVVHAVTSSVEQDEKYKAIKIEFEVHYSSCDIPVELFDQNKNPLTCCTIEMIPKSNPDKRFEEAVQMVASTAACRKLMRHICLQRPLKVMNNVEDHDVVSKYLLRLGPEFNIEENVPKNVKCSPPNESQREALHLALSNTFSVIQGPPGTGKTRTGAFLAYFFNQMNRFLPFNSRHGIAPKILYCGPSNKSVDVIAGYLKLFMHDDFSIVRVYSESIEQQDFPMPGVSSVERKFGSREEAKMDPQHRNIALHHMIRAHSAPHAQAIKAIEKNFKKVPIRITKAVKRTVKELKNLIKSAMIEELKNHQVILCTCNASGRAVLSRKDPLNIIQVIIDEAGMCSEPETLIPLVNHNPRQVVLIGDHMQLRPIIQEPHAKKLGAENSLMEKYQKRAFTLKIQYRMHEEICHFPSEAFYEGELQTAQAVKNRVFDEQTGRIWPNGPDYPRVFCHVVGVEEMLTVRSEEGNEMSRSNPLEVYHVVRIAKYFINHLKVNPSQLAILSQYRLQCSQIKAELIDSELRDIHVSTVIRSQGSEWDYVIFSTVRSMSKVEIEAKPGKGWKSCHLGFTVDENQMNVALTRARRGHVVIGNKYLLGTLEQWKNLLEMYDQTKSLLPASKFCN
ncbi:3'-5' exoribonuclease HELZ2-like isoform X1 [Apostichopus japonicus]|uniref:3'-5' exoribonuclease HELZ2-like isoform X1 n=1 Tax=Stichopus japonicus TaxID=307972 RepID=UPI003AB846F4